MTQIVSQGRIADLVVEQIVDTSVCKIREQIVGVVKVILQEHLRQHTEEFNTNRFHSTRTFLRSQRRANRQRFHADSGTMCWSREDHSQRAFAEAHSCDEGYELMLQGTDSVFVAKEYVIFSRARFSGAAEDVVRRCTCGDLFPWIHSVRWCEVRRGRIICSCGVSSSGFTTKVRCPCVHTCTVEFSV